MNIEGKDINQEKYRDEEIVPLNTELFEELTVEELEEKVEMELDCDFFCPKHK